jgi:hypothetical protein
MLGARMKPDASAVSLALGAVLLWAAWALMPDAATNDAGHILTAVGSARVGVRASAILQLAGAALLIAGLAVEAGDGRTRAGVIAMLIGSAGMAADAVYHQLAFEMTAPGVARDAVLPVMAKMQTDELRPLIPMLLLFPLGAVMLGIQRRRGGVGSPSTARLLIAPAIIVPLGVVCRVAFGLPGRVVALTVLGAICAGLIGVTIDRRRDHA